MFLRSACSLVLIAVTLDHAAAEAAPQNGCTLASVRDVSEGATTLRDISSKYRLSHLMTCYRASTYYVLVSDATRAKKSPAYCIFRAMLPHRFASEGGVVWRELGSSAWLWRQLEQPRIGVAYAQVPASNNCPRQTSSIYTVALGLSEREALRVLAFWTDISASQSAFDRLVTTDQALHDKVAELKRLIFPTEPGQDPTRLSWIRKSDWRFSHLWCITCNYYELIATVGDFQVHFNILIVDEKVTVVGLFETIR